MTANVRIVTSINGYNKIKEYIDNYIKEHPENKNLINLLEKTDLKYENNKQCYFGWNNYNWNEYSNENVELVMNGLYELSDNNYSYRFCKLGEEIENYEEYYFDSTQESEKNLEFPNIKREFDDSYIYNILQIEKQKKDLDKEDLDYE